MNKTLKNTISAFLAIAIILFPIKASAALLTISTGGLNATGSLNDGMEFTTNTAPVAISTTTTRPGSDGHSIRVNAGNGFIRNYLFTANQTTIGYIGVAVYIHSAVNAATQLVRWSNNLNSMSGNITLNTNNTLVLLKANGTQIGSASAALSNDTWYYVELKDDASGAGALEARLNGSVFATGANSSAGTWARALVGTITGTQTTSDVFFTDFKVTDNSGTSFNSYPGSGNVLIVRPNGAGETTQWTIAGSSPAATNWQSVNEVPPTDPTTLVNEALLNKEDLYTVGSTGLHSYDTINAVAVGVRFNNDVADATTSFKAEIEKASGGTKSQSTSIVPNNTAWQTNTVNGSTMTYPLVAYKDPDGAAWVGGGTLDSMRIGMIAGTVGVNKAQITNMWAYVDYTPGTPPAGNVGHSFMFFF